MNKWEDKSANIIKDISEATEPNKIKPRIFMFCWGCGDVIYPDEIWCQLHGKYYLFCACGKSLELELCDECAKAGAEEIKDSWLTPSPNPLK